MWRRESGQLKELAIIWCEEREKCNIRPVEVKDVYFNHENWTFEVDPIGPKHVISELRLSGLSYQEFDYGRNVPKHLRINKLRRLYLC